MKLSTLLVLTLIACGGGGPDAALEQATEKLAAADFAAAEASATRGLDAKSGEPAIRWRLELARLEAQARGKQGEAAKLSLERLATEYAGQVKGGLYATTAAQLRDAGDTAGAIGLLDAGMKRFPGDTELSAAIEQAKNAGTTDDVELLKQLGYVN